MAFMLIFKVKVLDLYLLKRLIFQTFSVVSKLYGPDGGRVFLVMYNQMSMISFATWYRLACSNVLQKYRAVYLSLSYPKPGSGTLVTWYAGSGNENRCVCARVCADWIGISLFSRLMF